MSDKEKALALKQKGNAAFSKHDWPAAVDFYTQAIDAYDQEPSFFSNRAQVISLVLSHRSKTHLDSGQHQVGGVWICYCRCGCGPQAGSELC